MRLASRLLIGLAFVAAPASAQIGEASPPIVIAPADRAALSLAIERGRLLYAYDQAAWYGTDDLTAKLPDFAKRLGGWVVDGPADAPTLIFFDRNVAQPQAVYIAQFKDGALVSSKLFGERDDRTLSADRVRLIAARRAGIEAFAKAGMAPCTTESANSVVLPPTTPDGPTLVYMLTPQPDMQTIPFGGHYRVTVSATGETSDLRRFTNACLNLPLTPPGGKQPVALGIRHFLDPVPTEIHVFSSLVAHKPVVVITDDGLWRVDGTQIRPMSPDEMPGLPRKP